MKKNLLLLVLMVLGYNSMRAQGLENVIVEVYYKSDANDATVNSIGGTLPIGSVTFRVYLDLLPDYILQSVYGDPNHECRIETSTLFFNNEDRGAVHPTFNCNYCDDNTVMLDSWLSVGAACATQLGVLKSEDDGVGTIVNSDGILTNTDPVIGIPLTQQDGLMAGTVQPVVAVGIGTELMVFDALTSGSVFSTTNGAWAALQGSVGADPAINKVLIAQITTDGVLTFSLNVQIRNELTLAVENYVSSNPQGTEILFPALNFYSPTIISVEEQSSLNPSFGIYPVPANDNATLVINTPVDVKDAVYAIYDILGNKIAEKNLGKVSGTSQYNVDLNTIAPGVYFVEVKMDGAISSKKIIRN